MIKVTLIKNGETIYGLEVKGHAKSNEWGKDLVCAGVSSILVGGFNAFDDSDIDEVSLDEGYAKIIVNSEKGLIILNTIIVQLKTMEVSYPKYIKIK